MQQEAFTLEQVAREFVLRWGYRPRQAWRYVHGWTQDEVAARYNQLIGDAQASMSGKRISDYEAWPVGGIKPTLNTLSVLAELYSTNLNNLVDFADYEAMTPPERIAFKTHVIESIPAQRERPGQHLAESNVDLDSLVRTDKAINRVLDRCLAYMTCYQDILDHGTYYQREIEDLLVRLNEVVREFVCKDAGWLDVMIPVEVPSSASTSLVEGVESDSGWLQILYSGVRRTTRPVTIPIEVNGTPWRGSATALLSRGMDYIASFKGRFAQYGLPPDVLANIENKYEYWKRESHFAALLAIAILSSENDSARSIGVLNINFERENPIGVNDTLEPQQSIVILNILEPTLRLLATAIDKHNQRK